MHLVYITLGFYGSKYPQKTSEENACRIPGGKMAETVKNLFKNIELSNMNPNFVKLNSKACKCICNWSV